MSQREHPPHKRLQNSTEHMYLRKIFRLKALWRPTLARISLRTQITFDICVRQAITLDSHVFEIRRQIGHVCFCAVAVVCQRDYSIEPCAV